MNHNILKLKNILLLVLVLTTCIGYSQRKPKIKGNRSVTELREDLPAYNAIELNDDLEITLQKSSISGYHLIADDNLVDVLKFEVLDSTLIISSFYNITAKKKLEITINYEELKSITQREGRIRMKDVVLADELYVNTFGSSKLELNANAAVLHLNMEGNSSGNLNLDSDSLNITLKDRIDVQIYAVSEINTIEMFKDAAARMEGTTDSLQVYLHGNSNLKAERLESASARAILEASANARLYAFKNFELSSRGSSKTYLYGTPKINILDFLDTSELHKRKE